MRRVQGLVAIVTGASSGVGWQTAVRLGEAGMKVCVTSRRQRALEALCEHLTERGVECLPVAGDVTVVEDVERVVSTCLEQFGRVDVLVNCAGVQSYARFEEYDFEEITRVMDVNAFGAMRFARAVMPHMLERGRGHIVNVASMLSKGAAPYLSAYTASKHAMLGWSEALRLENRTRRLDVSAVLVPSVSTPMFDHAPTHLGRAPRPVPPTYPTDVAARAVLRVLRRPRPVVVPVFLQGHLILWMNRYVPFVGDWLLSRFGRRLQTGPERIERERGNLFEPMAQGIGPTGSVPATPVWKRVGATALVAAGLLAATGGAARALRS